MGLLLVLLAIFAPAFFDPQPLLSRLTAAAPKLVLACGVALVIISRQIDISIGSLFAVCGASAGWVAEAGAPLPVAVAAALGVGVVVGASTGALVAGLRLPSIVVTLAVMVTLREALRLQQQGVFINLPAGVQWFGLPMGTGQGSVCAVAAFVALALAVTSRHVALGRFVYAVGSDAEAARLAG
ncbi:MAG TPA: ABC transporter permease, partial [Methylomirabilota bacterium]|nr:ABC transporter permease [Methylomirabilota bacterium]